MAENKKPKDLSPQQTFNGQRLLRISGSSMRIATWNVRTMCQTGKIHNAIKEMKRLNIDILGIRKMRWTGTGKCTVDDHMVYYAGTSDGIYQHGVGAILDKNVAKHVTNFVPISERIMLLQINTSPIKMNIIQVYAPTNDARDDEVEKTYNRHLKETSPQKHQSSYGRLQCQNRKEW